MARSEAGSAPPDGTQKDDAGASVLDTAPEPAPRPRSGVRVKQTKKGSVQVDFQEPPEAVTQQALDDQDIVSMAEIGSARPNLPKAIQGTLTVKRESVNYSICEDGATPAEPGYAGTVPDAPGFQEVIIEKWGGGTYVYTGIGKNGKPIADRLNVAGYSRPIPGTQQGYPNGAMPNARGGFDRGWPQDQGQGPIDPADDPNFDPSQGVAPEEFAQSGINGWQFNAGTGRWIFYSNGVPSRHPRGSRPPSFPGVGGMGGFDPSAFDHSGDDRLSRLEKLVEKLADGGGKPSGLDAFLQAQADREARREERERERRDDERDARREQLAADKEARAQERERERDKIEAERDARRETLAAEKEREERRATAERETRAEQRAREQDVATTTSKNSVEMARIKADADKEVSKNNAEILKAGNEAATRANERIIDVVMKKSDDVGLLTKGMQIMADVSGAKSTVAEISSAIKETVPALIDGAIAYKTSGVQSGGGAPAGEGASDDDMMARMVGLLARLCVANTPASESVMAIAGACNVSSFDEKKIDPLIALGTPSVVATYLETAAAKAVDEGNKKKMLEARALLLTDEGKAWFSRLKAEFAAKRKRGAPQPAGQIQGPGPSTPGK